MAKFKLRLAQRQDASQIAELSNQLGYINDTDSILVKFAEFEKVSDFVIYVVENCEKIGLIVGLAHFKIHRSFLADSALEVAGLIVDEKYRGQGVGKILMTQAEKTAEEWGLSRIRLTSNISRLEAHQFYLKLGFTQSKTSHLFVK